MDRRIGARLGRAKAFGEVNSVGRMRRPGYSGRDAVVRRLRCSPCSRWPRSPAAEARRTRLSIHHAAVTTESTAAADDHERAAPALAGSHARRRRHRARRTSAAARCSSTSGRRGEAPARARRSPTQTFVEEHPEIAYVGLNVADTPDDAASFVERLRLVVGFDAGSRAGARSSTRRDVPAPLRPRRRRRDASSTRGKAAATPASGRRCSRSSRDAGSVGSAPMTATENRYSTTLPATWLASRMAVDPARIDAMRRAGELIAVREPGSTEWRYPAWQFDAGEPRPAVARVVAAARESGIDERAALRRFSPRQLGLRDGGRTARRPPPRRP